MGCGRDIAFVVAVVVVGAQTDGGGETVVDLTGDIDLSAIDILLAFHLRVDIVHLGCDDGTLRVGHEGCDRLLKDLSHRHGIEHGNAFFVFHEAATTHDTDHG